MPPLVLGTDYDGFYDIFEILLSLEHAYQQNKISGRYWSPIGRFGWKEQSGSTQPYRKLIERAEELEGNWAPIKAGFFGGSFDAFKETTKYMTDRISRLQWL